MTQDCLFLPFRRGHDRWRSGKSLFSGSRICLPHGQLHVQSQHLHLLGEVGRPQLRDHLVRQHRPRYAHRLPVCQYGGLDSHSILGKTEKIKIQTILVRQVYFMSRYKAVKVAHYLLLMFCPPKISYNV